MIATRNNFDRLEKLANHLERGKLGHAKFDFSTINEGKLSIFIDTKNRCGSAGCAMGELPIAFPKAWKYEDFNREDYENCDGSLDLTDTANLSPILKSRGADDEDLAHDLKDFFGIDLSEQNHLFYPRDQNITKFGGKVLGERATRYQVASNIRSFIKLKKAALKELKNAPITV